jgi:hypothetical protein
MISFRCQFPIRLSVLALVGVVGACLFLFGSPVSAQQIPFQHVVIDAKNPSNPHSKTLGDINGDGFLDALAASSSGGGMYWYAYPGWRTRVIRSRAGPLTPLAPALAVSTAWIWPIWIGMAVTIT